MAESAWEMAQRERRQAEARRPKVTQKATQKVTTSRGNRPGEAEDRRVAPVRKATVARRTPTADVLRPVERAPRRERELPPRVIYNVPPSEERLTYNSKMHAMGNLTKPPDMGWSSYGDSLQSGAPAMDTIGIGGVEPPRIKPRPPLYVLPEVGPVGDLRTQTSLQYGFTPESRQMLRQVPVTLQPPSQAPGGIAAYYHPEDKSIEQWYRDPAILAHEQAHAWWYDRGMENDPIANTEYNLDFGRWRDDSSSSLSVPNRTQRWYDRGVESGTYPASPRATELYAESVAASPVGWEDRRLWPSYMKPYYAGFLEGMGR